MIAGQRLGDTRESIIDNVITVIDEIYSRGCIKMYVENKHRAEAYCMRYGHAWEQIDAWVKIDTDDFIITCEEIHCPRCGAHGIFNQRFNWEPNNADMDDDRAEDDS